MENRKTNGALSEFNLPEWETTSRHRRKAGGNIKRKMTEHFDRVMPSHRKYFGFGRQIACIMIVVIVVAIIVFIVGLAAGVSHQKSKNHKPKSLPLGSETYAGDLTYYGPGLGACGVTSQDKDNIVSISHTVFDAVAKGSNPNQNPLCGHKLRAILDSKSVDVTVVDRCTLSFCATYLALPTDSSYLGLGCKAMDLDVSPGAFQTLADPHLGRVKITWAWLPPVPST